MNWEILKVDRIRGSEKVTAILRIWNGDQTTGAVVNADSVQEINKAIDEYISLLHGKGTESFGTVLIDLISHFPKYKELAIKNLYERNNIVDPEKQKALIERLDEPASSNSVKKVKDLCETLGIDPPEGIETWNALHLLALQQLLEKKTKGLTA